MRFKSVHPPIYFLLFLVLTGCKTTSTAKLDFSDGSYEGQLNSEGKKHGSGIYRWIDGSIYEGDYLNDLRHGHGRFLWANGESYEGDYLKDERTGKGTYSWPDGSFYKGEFLSGKRHGRGLYQSLDNTVYEGEWFDDLQHGQGTLKYSDGRVLAGVWRKGSLVSKPAALPASSKQPILPKEVLHKKEITVPTAPPPEVKKTELEVFEKNLEPNADIGASPVPITVESINPAPLNPSSGFPEIEQQPEDPSPSEEPQEKLDKKNIFNQTVPLEEDQTEANWTGTVTEAEAFFITELVNGLDTVRLRTSGMPFTGRMRIVNSAGQAKGEVNLLNGRMHGQEIFYNDTGEVVEKNYWENGRRIGQ